MFLLLDTETTGFSGIVNIIQFSWMLCNDQFEQIKLEDYVIKLGEVNCTTIEMAMATITSRLNAEMIHGISQEMSDSMGTPFADVAQKFYEVLKQCTYIVAHNAAFDKRIILAELTNYNLNDIITEFNKKSVLCTMKNCTKLTGLLNITGKAKPPKLDELYRHLFHVSIPYNEQHNSKYDVINLHKIVKRLYDTHELNYDGNANVPTSIKGLQQQCKELGLKGYSKLTKQQLLDLISSHESGNKVPLTLRSTTSMLEDEEFEVNLKSTFILPEMSNEQAKIIHYLRENNNLIVDSVAGSGKTTSNLHIAKQFPNLKILLLTYNAKLKIETREKVHLLNLKNIETHSYHSFCFKYYDNSGHDDKIITNSIRRNIPLKKQVNYDVLILDEAQDMNPLLFEFVCKIVKDNLQPIQICLLGDKFQSIYQFNFADERFITMADQLFTLNQLPWTQCKLSQSFRATKPMASFINNCMLNDDRIQSYKESHYKPKYMVCNAFDNEHPYNSVRDFLEMGYLPQDIFVLAPSIKTASSPVRQLENKIKTRMPHISVYVPVSDDEKLDKEVMNGKIVFSTFHQTKGLERKVVLVYNFDNSYFTYYGKEKDPLVCPNELYVATTRSSEQLVLIHHFQNEYLPFLNNVGQLRDFCDFTIHHPLNIAERGSFQLKTTPTDLIHCLPASVIDKCCDYLIIDQIQIPTPPLDITLKTKQGSGYENVSEITGTAIPSYFEYVIKGKMTIFDKLQKLMSYQPKTGSVDMLLASMEDGDVPDNKKKYDIHKINISCMTPDELLYVANNWCGFMSGFIFKTVQIIDYNWMSLENLNTCMDRLHRLGISNNAIFEAEFTTVGKPELLKRQLTGFIDCIDGPTINIIYN